MSSENDDRKNDIMLQFESYEELLKYFNQFNKEQEIGWRKRGGIINGRLKGEELVQFLRSKSYIYWRGQTKPRDPQPSTWPMIQFKFDGSPFLIVGRETFICHQGPNVDRNRNIMNRIAYEKRTGKVRETRPRKVPSKKKNCPARAEILYVLKLFNLKTRYQSYDKYCTLRMGQEYRRIHRKYQTEEELNNHLGICHIFLLRITHPTMHTCQYFSGIGITEPHNAIGPMACVDVSNETKQNKTSTPKQDDSNVIVSTTNTQLSKRHAVDQPNEVNKKEIKKQKLASTIVQINIDSFNEMARQEMQRLNSISNDHVPVNIKNDVNCEESDYQETPCHKTAESQIEDRDCISEIEEDTEIISMRENPPGHGVGHEDDDPLVTNEMSLSTPGIEPDVQSPVFEIHECRMEDVEIPCDKARWPNAPDIKVEIEEDNELFQDSTSPDYSTSKMKGLKHNIDLEQKRKIAIKLCESLKDILLETESEEVLNLFLSSGQKILKILQSS